MAYSFNGAQPPANDPALNKHFAHHPSGLLDWEIDQIRDYADRLPTKAVGLNATHDDRHVKARGAFFALNEDTQWVYDRLADVVQRMNARDFRYDLTGFECFYYMAYQAPDEHFNWHYDTGPEPPVARKLSLTLQLSDPSEYEGGDFEIMTAIGQARARKAKGLVTAFPSFKMHRVTPVTAGKRRVLTMFAVGPNFR
jgi:PKHD-type hydroxylase